MSAAHTPGPWVAVSSIPEEGVNCWWVFARRPGGAMHEVGCVNGPQGSMTEPDALLVAAAPDLLAALKGVVAISDSAIPEFVAARAAIAKAEGA